MAITSKQVKHIEGVDPSSIPEAVLGSTEPLVLKGLAKSWPMVQAGLKSDAEAVSYLKQFYSQKKVVMYQAAAEKKGRFFYTEDCKGLDFESQYTSLDTVLDRLLECKQEQKPDTYYVGSTTIDVCLPDFRIHNDLELNHLNPLVSIWIGNRSKVAAHFDGPDNIACCVAGKRRFTLFPIEAIDHLYVGPLDYTPSGQVISMVDFDQPDLDKFPKFQQAMDMALVADMEPGDGLYLPSMWWHHVESMSDFNVLVNYWWRDYKRFMDVPINAMHYAMMSIRDLPQKEKEAWRHLFNYYVFDQQQGKNDHIPENARGFLSELNETSARQLRAWLLNKLNK